MNEVALHAQLRYVHLAASAGLLRFSIPCANTVRPGLMLYGVSRTLPANHGVSYGRCFLSTRPMRVATIGIGYADGWRRHLSCKQVFALIHGVLCPLLGRVTMDQIMADISAVPEVKAGDFAELIGPSLRVEHLAAQTGTIPWDILTGLGPRLPRFSRSFD